MAQAPEVLHEYMKLPHIKSHHSSLRSVRLAAALQVEVFHVIYYLILLIQEAIN